jgi:hypothetical protein
MALIESNGRVHRRLIHLIDQTVSQSAAAEAMAGPVHCNTILQREWLSNQQYRSQIKGVPPTEEQVAILRDLDCILPRFAPLGDYDGAFLLGCMLKRARTRLDWLISQYQAGVNFKQLFVLGSRRKLDPVKESREELSKILSPRGSHLSDFSTPLNEIEMMQFVVSQTNIPDDWAIAYINTPDLDDPKKPGEKKTATTGDTFEEWSRKFPYQRFGKYLVVSNQPFVNYQVLNARGTFKKLGVGIEVTGTGHSADTSLPLLTFLDNLAKEFYEECKLLGFIP